ncbi:DUF7453 family protein [Adhaeretor mobilis]|uniref:PEP-CTERM protein-sorting domain-containing protein n=1 Tax=Adhaeretor mobilis TaxID=1930276 RepID=A0A517N369_9BACT|nr:choice-of-anchor tandem repeat NxxGxxAF-containing protein [Adhaeretor mobilis]QDT01585.1 hypothetical protein HG15A2_49320 [Adhaeretor mobilis]
MKRFTLLLVAMFPLTPAVGRAQLFTTSALTGDVVDGETLTGFSQFVAPYILPNGDTVFTANTAGGEQAIVAQNEVAFLTGSQVPGAAPGVNYNVFGTLIANDQGDLALLSLFDGGPISPANDRGIIVRESGTADLAVQKGDAVVGTGDTSDTLGLMTYDSAGDGTFRSTLAGSGETTISYLPHSDGSPQKKIIATGDIVDSNQVTETNTVSTNASRRLALYARKWSPFVTGSTALDVAGRTIPTNTGLLESGNSGFGLPAGTTIKDFFVPKLNDADQVTVFTEYHGFVSGTSVHQFQIDDTSVTSGRSVAKTGDMTPGLGGHEFNFFSNFVANETGGVALFAAASPSSPPANATSQFDPGGPQAGVVPVEGVWFEDSGGTLTLAAYNGQQASGLDAGVTMQQIAFPAFNDLNQVAFKTHLAGPGVIGFQTDEALWATDLNGDLQLIVRKGDLFDVDDDPNTEDLRTINAIAPIANSAGTGGVSTSFNDAGQLAFTLNFTDFTSGVFVANLVGTTLSADTEPDGDVDGADFLALQRTNPSLIPTWRTEYGSGGSVIAASQQVPEPSAIALLLLSTVTVATYLRLKPASQCSITIPAES